MDSLVLKWFLVGGVLAVAGASASTRAHESTDLEHRFAHVVRYLADDRMAGRGMGSPEIDLVAEYLVGQFHQKGLAVRYQPFSYVQHSEQGSANHAVFANDAKQSRIDWKVDVDFRPLAIGGAGAIDTPLVFVGYGITAPELDYDDYAGVDVQGKTVIVLRHEPQQHDPYSEFDGLNLSKHAPFMRKIKNAIDHGAAAVVFCTDLHETQEMRRRYEMRIDALNDKLLQEQNNFNAQSAPTPSQTKIHGQRMDSMLDRESRLKAMALAVNSHLLPFDQAGQAVSEPFLPVMVATRDALEQLFTAAGRGSLAELEVSIDDDLQPRSFELSGWRMVANVDITRQEVTAMNVVATIEAEGPHADEAIVIGAHFDHLGRGGDTAFKGQIHNGADDNASGVAMMLELARHYASQPEPPPRRLVFVAFTGEERGLMGSRFYVDHPAVPLENTVAMFNFDMVGRLSDNRLIMSGTDTAKEFSQLVRDVNNYHSFDLQCVPGGLGPSDHASFYTRGVPVLHFFTGLHNDYHRPSDDVHLVDIAGMRRIYGYASELIDQVLYAPERPQYQQTDGPSRP
ncbi:M20/M25/M40 family metallo-hydrolase [Aeoliella mucimassa]|uniref:M20/M25/M40 family metallo-hydrolase n=1 Tax=Aeoliella mucimassa TaxID=2527972 RepID=UPI0018D3AAF1|nr:M20/M25/M40 family metallo-hydrolase [Aeoliella mucimassa]